jgi:uncharacterized protein with NRDE domain
MCLILLAWKAHPEFPLVVAANRDEFFARPTAPADFWPDVPNILAGRDLQGGGTWLGVTRDGRFAALTNFRDPGQVRAAAPSRGELVARFLRGEDSSTQYTAWLSAVAGGYNGFNLVYGDLAELHYFSNCGDRPHRLAPGIYGLSNHLLDTPWPKVERGKSALSAALHALPDEGPLLALLRDDAVARDEDLPRTGVSLAWERLLSAAFVRSADYGTRSSTLLRGDADGTLDFTEIGFDSEAREIGRRRFSLRPVPPPGS